MTVGHSIDYDALHQEAMRGLVRQVLQAVAKTGLPGEHHFFIAFDTRAPGVGMSRRLKEKYPEEMMIVLQHRFWDLGVTDERFEVKLTFDGIPERLAVPFAALKLFIDPSVRYSIQFEEPAIVEEPNELADRRRQRDQAEIESISRRPTELRSVKTPEPAEDAPAPAPVPAPAPAPVAHTPRPADPPPATEPAAKGEDPPDTAPVVPAASPAGAKIVSIDSWRNRK